LEGETAMSITVHCVEFYDVQNSKDRKPITRLTYAEWSRDGGEIEHANLLLNRLAENEGEEAVIPDDVRIALAMLVAPGLVVEAAFVRDSLIGIQAELHLQRGRLGEQMDLAKDKTP
jgi:hypothetical protein